MDKAKNPSEETFAIAFGSCNKVGTENPFWAEITLLQPDLFIWGGDNIYGDTEDMGQMEQMYAEQDAVTGYAEMKSKTPVLGTWDDHDYGKNDAGVEFKKKKESQQLFLDFMDVPEKDARREREGVYHAQTFEKKGKRVKIIVLDTRYFRDALNRNRGGQKGYGPAEDSSGTILGAEQWKWLAEELSDKTPDFNLVVSSIQLLSAEHQFEKWSNFPKERERFIDLLKTSKAKRVLVISGDRHISEFSKMEVPGLNYPLIDFTDSGLTHAYTSFTGEPNALRVGEVVPRSNFGWIEIDLKGFHVKLQMRDVGNEVLKELKQQY